MTWEDEVFLSAEFVCKAKARTSRLELRDKENGPPLMVECFIFIIIHSLIRSVNH